MIHNWDMCVMNSCRRYFVTFIDDWSYFVTGVLMKWKEFHVSAVVTEVNMKVADEAGSTLNGR